MGPGSRMFFLQDCSRVSQPFLVIRGLTHSQVAQGNLAGPAWILTWQSCCHWVQWLVERPPEPADGLWHSNPTLIYVSVPVTKFMILLQPCPACDWQGKSSLTASASSHSRCFLPLLKWPAAPGDSSGILLTPAGGSALLPAYAMTPPGGKRNCVRTESHPQCASWWILCWLCAEPRNIHSPTEVWGWKQNQFSAAWVAGGPIYHQTLSPELLRLHCTQNCAVINSRWVRPTCWSHSCTAQGPMWQHRMPERGLTAVSLKVWITLTLWQFL